MTAEERMNICKSCPLYKVDEERGPVCNGDKYISPDGNKSSYIYIPGYKKGCNCMLKIKTKSISSHCICGKW